MKKLALLFFLGLSLSAHSQVYVLGYPRSGTHWLCYSLSNVFNKPVISQPFAEVPLTRNLPQGTTDWKSWYRKEVPPSVGESIFFSHQPVTLGLPDANRNNDFLIVIIRDYKESFSRERYTKNKGPLTSEDVSEFVDWYSNREIEDCYDCVCIDYINSLACYQNWNPGRRLLIYYEDLITDFESVLTQCIEILDPPEDSLDDFMNNYDEHVKGSKEMYRRWEGSKSKGNTKYHQQMMTRDNRLRLDHLFKEKFPFYWENYLKRYETQ